MVSLNAVPAVCVPGFDSVKVIAAAGETVNALEVTGYPHRSCRSEWQSRCSCPEYLSPGSRRSATPLVTVTVRRPEVNPPGTRLNGGGYRTTGRRGHNVAIRVLDRHRHVGIVLPAVPGPGVTGVKASLAGPAGEHGDRVRPTSEGNCSLQ